MCIPNLAVLLRVQFNAFTADRKLYEVKVESSENTTLLAAIPHPVGRSRAGRAWLEQAPTAVLVKPTLPTQKREIWF